ncbi:sulfite exporter TauE/SafE family protein [Rodentibacter haemolyticus]|uniref:Probable membrane transporter protein n=1 Tax=Rodentibacter haemolyticus TaxID=2778911 RepID=A0ABX6V051_9PAST|nr:sulfite exporter TauE/SafE family protein [Rodentibacter haemolyticus]QPB43648.1 sulfite exporter TauE/SafE family protein [Rodentibacter haemolyticus]
MSLSLILILILCGVMTNIMSAVFGIGGGVLMVPLLYTLFPDFPLPMVAATSLTIVIGSALINLIYFYKQHIPINVKSVLCWSIAMIIGVQIGFESSFYVPDLAIISLFIGTLSLLAFKTLSRSQAAKPHSANGNDLIKGMGLCLLGGSIAGMTGIGGGSIMAPLISQLNSVQPRQIAPYTNTMMILGGTGSLYGYLAKTPPFYLPNSWQIGYVNFAIVAIVVCSTMITGFFSMKLRRCLPPVLTQKLLGGILLFIAVYTLGVYWVRG